MEEGKEEWGGEGVHLVVRERKRGGGNVLCMQEMKSNQWSKRVLLGEN